MEDLGHCVLALRGGGSGCEPDAGEAPPVTIVQFTDIHHFPHGCASFDRTAEKGRVVPIPGGYATTPGGYSTGRSLETMAEILARVQPDLVVLTGDIIDGRAVASPPSGNVPAWRGPFLEVLRPIVAAGLPWTFVPGNHDDDGGPWTRDDLLGVFQLGDAAPNCISEGARSFSHTLTVGPTTSGTHPSSVRLWLLDSGGNNIEDPSKRYETFSAATVAGFRHLSSQLPKQRCGLAYFHIPLPQCNGLKPVFGTQRLFEAALAAGMVPRPFCWRPFTWIVRLLGKDRVVGSSKLESGMFEALVKSGVVSACFFGHDHHSDAVFRRDRLYMAYGRVSGTTPPIDWEGDSGPLPFPIGARVVQWDPSAAQSSLEGVLSTWVEVREGRESGSEFVFSRI